jgi:hypothetical protein
MNKEQIISIIKGKIIEHKSIIEEIDFDLKNTVKEKKIESAMKHLVLKDKMIFHKAAILTLEDLLTELNNG